MSTQSTKENRAVVSISRPSSIKLPPLPAVNYPRYNHQVSMTENKRMNIDFLSISINLCIDNI